MWRMDTTRGISTLIVYMAETLLSLNIQNDNNPLNAAVVFVASFYDMVVAAVAVAQNRYKGTHVLFLRPNSATLSFANHRRSFR